MIFSILEAKKHHIFFFYEYQSRAQKWCKREQSQAGLNYAECSPFSHGKNNQLSDTLATFFSKNINLAHIKLISLFMMALCKAGTVCFCKLSTCFDSPAKADSCLRRIQRFFSEHSISQNLVAKFIFQQLPRKEKYRLAIDRTNWQFGKTDINIFMLAVIHDGVAYPL